MEELPPATALNNPIIAPGMFPDAADKAAETPFATSLNILLDNPSLFSPVSALIVL